MECLNQTRAQARKARANGEVLSLILIVVSFIATACGSDYSGGASSGSARKDLPAANIVASSDETLTVAMRYLAFTDSSGMPVASEGEVKKMVDDANRFWRQCNIEFRLENYRAINSSEIGARFNPANYNELDNMRIMSQRDADLLYVGTGSWNRSGDLGNGRSNCFSSFPGDQAQGIVCEKKSAASSVMMAHEVGHWLNLRHTNSPSTDAVDDTNSGNVGNNLMDHIVGWSNDDLTRGQCQRARRSIAESRRNAVLQ